MSGVVTTDQNKSEKRKRDKIALYGRAHRGPRRRRKGRRNKDIHNSESSKTQQHALNISRLPLVNAANTASNAAMAVLQPERRVEVNRVATESVVNWVRAGVERRLSGQPSNNQTSKRRTKDQQPQNEGKRRSRWRNHSRSGKPRFKNNPFIHGTAVRGDFWQPSHFRTRSNFSYSSFATASVPNGSHSRAHSMTYHVRRESLNLHEDSDIVASHQPVGVPYFGHMYSNVRHVPTFSSPGSGSEALPNMAQHKSSNSVAGDQTQPWSIKPLPSTSQTKTKLKQDNWWVTNYDERKSRGGVSSDVSQGYAVDPESLELLVQDLALALPSPNTTKSVCLVDPGSDDNVGSARNQRAQLAIRLAEEERERRVKEEVDKELQEKLERASRIEWAVKAIESERQRLASIYADSVENDRKAITGSAQKHGSLEEYEVVCPYSVVGCCVTCLRSELPSHLDSCPARKESQSSLAQAAIEKESVYNPLDHVVMCPFRVVGCTVSCPRARLPEHLVKCPCRPEAEEDMPNLDHACLGAYGQRTFDSYEVICPYSILGCEHTCLRSELQHHWDSCTYRPKTRQEEEAERVENMKIAIQAAEDERQRRVLFLQHGVQEATSIRQQRAEWVVKAAQIEKLRLVCEQLAIERQASRVARQGIERKARRAGSLDEYGETWGHESDGSVVILSDDEEETRAKRSSSLCSGTSRDSCNRPEPLLRGHLDRQTEALYEELRVQIDSMSKSFTNGIECQQPLHQAIIEKVTETVAQLWPTGQGLASVRVERFGSYATGFAVPGVSDLDLVVVIPGRVETHHQSNLVHQPVSDIAAARWMRESSGGVSAERLQAGIMCGLLGRALRSSPWASQVKVIDRAEVPVIKIESSLNQFREGTASLNIVHEDVQITTGQTAKLEQSGVLSVDLTFAIRSHAGLEAVEVVTALKHKFPKLVPLVQLLKAYLHEKQLNNPFTGGLSSYALILMVTASLMKHQNRVTSIGEDLFNFLQLFGQDFNPKKRGIICRVSSGAEDDSISGKQLHIAIASRKISKSMQHGVDMSHVALVVDDPLRAGNNVAKSCFAFVQVQKAFRVALAALLSYVVRCDKVDSNSLLEEVFHIKLNTS